MASESITVYFCTMRDCPPSRGLMRDRCLLHWEAIEGVEVKTLIGLNPQFQRERRVVAEAEAEGEFYFLVDDDCCVPPSFRIGKLLRIMHEHPSVGIVSALPANAKINLWTPEEYETLVTPEFFEHHSVGGLRLIRKGVVRPDEFPPQTRRGYDNEHCDMVRLNGYRVGYSTLATYLHLGEGIENSTVWR